MPESPPNSGIILNVTGQSNFLMVVYASSNRAIHFPRAITFQKINYNNTANRILGIYTFLQ